MHSVTINRTNHPPLKLVGEVIGHASSKAAGKPKWTDITIYSTDSGPLVCQVDHRSTAIGDRAVFTKAEVFHSGRALIDWLKADNGGSLGGVSNDALGQASSKSATIREAWVVVV